MFWKISARTYVPLPRNAGRTGTSQRPNSKRRGSKAARKLFYPHGETYVQTLGEQD